MKKSLLYTTFFSVFALGVADFFARQFYLYWTWRWFDSVSHFLGGLAIGFLVLWIWALWKKIVPTKKEVFLVVIIGVMLVGIGWEVFEYIYGIAQPSTSETYLEDTTYDLVADLFGALVAGYWVVKKIFKQNA